MDFIDIGHGIQSTIIDGIGYGIGSIGLSIIYKYLKFPDFTTIASMIVGGIATIHISNYTCISFGILCSIILSGFLGFVTGLQVANARIPGILAGIITGTGAITFAFLMTTGGTNALTAGHASTAEYFAPNTFNWLGLAQMIIYLIVISFLVSRFFKTQYGAYTLALLGTDYYLKYRHREVKPTQKRILIMGNAVIGFAGSLIALHAHTAQVQSHQDFLIVAIGGYSFGNFLLQLLSTKSMKGLLEKEKKPSAGVWVQTVHFLTSELHLNDEEPKKIFFTLLFYSASAAIISVIFKSVETVANIGHYSYVFKALILLAILILGNWYSKMAKSISTY